LLTEQNVTLLESRKRVRQRLFLFDDLIVLTAVSSRSLKFVEEVPLLGIRFHSLMDNESVYNGFELQTMTKLWTFVCDSYDSKVEFESIIISALSQVNNISIDGLKEQKKKPSTLAAAAATSSSGNVGLQKIRLEGEIRAISENISRLPKESAEKLLSSRFSAMIALMEDHAVLNALLLDQESLLLATKVLESSGSLMSTIKVLGKGFLQSFGSSDESAVVAAFKKETLLTSLVGHAASILAPDWVEKLVAPLVNSSNAKGQVGQLFTDLPNAMKTAPPFVRGAVYVFRHIANKKYRGSTGGDEASFAFLMASMFCFALKQRSGNSQSEALGLMLQQTPVAGVLESCSDQAGKITPTIRKSELEQKVLPQLLENMVRDIEAFSGDKVCKALASAIVLKK
jgi:hypothetical protein